MLSHILTSEELTVLSEPIRNKLDKWINENVEAHFATKALFEAHKKDSGTKVTSLTSELELCQNDRSEIQQKLSLLEIDFKNIENKYETSRTELSKLQESIKRAEEDNEKLREQRDGLAEQNSEMAAMLERRNGELARLQEDILGLQTQLQAAVAAKCEALIGVDEIETKKLNFELKEKRMEQEKELLNQQIASLNVELVRVSEELANTRRENLNNLMTIQVQLSDKSEENKISSFCIEKLKEENKDLAEQLETLKQKLVGLYEGENKLRENYQSELEAQTKVADLYKGMNEEASKKIEELIAGTQRLQALLNEASDKYSELETEFKAKETYHKEVLAKKNETISSLKQELVHANDLLKSLKQEQAIDAMSPSATACQRLQRSGLTFTALYSDYKTVSDELLLKTQENENLKTTLDQILKELELKSPLIQKLQEDYSYIVQKNEGLIVRMDELEIENKTLQMNYHETEKMLSHMKRENKNLKENLKDLGRQVCFLLKEIQEQRGTVVTMANALDEFDKADVTDSSKMISKHLVTFADIEELQLNNQKLLAVVHQLSEKNETAEKAQMCMNFEELESRLKNCENELAEEKRTVQRFEKMLEIVKGQRDLFRTLFKQQVSGTVSDEKLAHLLNVDENLETQQSPLARTDTKTPASPNDVSSSKVKEIKTELEKVQKELSSLKAEYESNREERKKNELMLNEELASAQKELQKLRSNNVKLIAKEEFNEEKIKTLTRNMNNYKNQITALELKCKSYSETISKHEQSIVHLANEAKDANTKLAKSTVTIESLRQNVNILKDREVRLTAEKEAMQKEKHGQAFLLSNLEAIKASMDRSEAEGRINLERKLDDSIKECNALRRKLLEEQDKYKEKIKTLENSVEIVKARLEEEKSARQNTLIELKDNQDILSEKDTIISQLNEKIKNMLKNSGSDFHTESRFKELKKTLNDTQRELESCKEMLASANQHSQNFKDIAESSEQQLAEITHEFNSFKSVMEEKLAAATELEKTLRSQLEASEKKVKELLTLQSEASSQMTTEITSNKEELVSIQNELNITRHELERTRADYTAAIQAANSAEEKYSHEMVLHAADIQALKKLREDLSNLNIQLLELQKERDHAVNTLNEQRVALNEKEMALKEEKESIQTRVKDLDAQNATLHSQLEALSFKMASIHQSPRSGPSAGGDAGSKDSSFSDDEAKSSEQLLQIIKYLRREKDIAVSQFDALRSENVRLKSELELTRRQLEEAQAMLESERNKAEVDSISVTKHAELLRKVETFYALTDSNRSLRAERDEMLSQLKVWQNKLEELDAQVVQPLKEENSKLSAQVDQLTTENSALQAKTVAWQQRASALLERANENSPEDIKRLTTEKENLTKDVAALTAERDQLKTEKDNLLSKIDAEKLAHENSLEELRTIREKYEQLIELSNKERKQLEIQTEKMENLTLNVEKLTAEINAQTQLAESRKEETEAVKTSLIKLEEEFKQMSSNSQQIRFIAKKYKTQCQELTKTIETLKSEVAKATSAPVELPEEEKEKLREEGRSSLSERLKELTDQVSSSQAESDNLRQENESLKASFTEKETRAKDILKNTRLKMHQLSAENARLEKEVNESKGKVSQVDSDAKMNALKTQYESRISRLEKEKSDLEAEKDKLSKDLETLTSRVNNMQRHLNSLQGPKPSTSSSSEKLTSDPPTANIKPMAGPSSGAGKQQQPQQAVTVAPWRDTPLASIRPITMSRTMAVPPTTNSSVASVVPQHQQLLQPQHQPQTQTQQPQTHQQPQQNQPQQLVDTSSSEMLSASPTSSHIDYTPFVRPIMIESTNDLEVECGNEDQHHVATHQTQPVQGLAAPGTQTQVNVALVLPRERNESAQPVAEQSVSNSQDSNQQNFSIVSNSSSCNQETSSTLSEQSVSGSTNSNQTNELVSASNQQHYQPERSNESNNLVSSQQSLVASSHENVTPEQSIVVASSHQSIVVASSQQSVTVASSHQAEPSSQATCSHTVTTTHAGHKRVRDSEGDASSHTDDSGKDHVVKRSRVSVEQEENQGESEVEYQVPTSSQRDQEDDAITVDSENSTEEEVEDEEEEEEEDGSGLTEDGHGDYEEGYEMETYDRDDQEIGYNEGEENSEVEVMDSHRGGQSSEATSSHMLRRPAAITPLSRQQQLLLPQNYEDAGDDSIVPSTPTLFLPHRLDGFGEAVSSPHVPTTGGRFTFVESGTPVSRAGVAQVASEGMDDTTIDLSQLETGRSVPSTPLQVSPQGEGSGEIGQSEEDNFNEEDPEERSESESAQAVNDICDDEDNNEEPQNERRDDDSPPLIVLDLNDDDGDEVTSEGEKTQASGSGSQGSGVEEEGREAEAATQSIIVQLGRGNSARRSIRTGFMGRGRSRQPITPIVWDEVPSTAMGPSSQRGSRGGRNVAANILLDNSDIPRGGPFRGGRIRRSRGAYHYQPRF